MIRKWLNHELASAHAGLIRRKCCSCCGAEALGDCAVDLRGARCEDLLLVRQIVQKEVFGHGELDRFPLNTKPLNQEPLQRSKLVLRQPKPAKQSSIVWVQLPGGKTCKSWVLEAFHGRYHLRGQCR